jgi:two-component system LytT family response regulator
MSGLQFQEEIKTLLVDDEEIAIHRLKKSLSLYPRIKIIGEARDGRSAVEFINGQRPDLVFLDIQMPEFNGLEVLNLLEYTPMIVFVTAYDEYAIKAFEKDSLDYLLKPVEDERLAVTIKRILQNKRVDIVIPQQAATETISTIPVKTGNKVQLVHIADVCFFEAKDKYVILHTNEAEKLIEYPLGYLQERLPAEFVRVHRSFIINKLKIREIHKYFKGTFVILMNDAKGSKIKSAYSYYDAIKEKILVI